MAVSRQDASRHPLPEPLQRTLERLGFVCEDEVWNGWQRPHAFRCSAGHALALAPARLSNLLGCRACHGRRTLWQCLRLAAERLGGMPGQRLAGQERNASLPLLRRT